MHDLEEADYARRVLWNYPPEILVFHTVKATSANSVSPLTALPACWQHRPISLDRGRTRPGARHPRLRTRRMEPVQAAVQRARARSRGNLDNYKLLYLARRYMCTGPICPGIRSTSRDRIPANGPICPTSVYVFASSCSTKAMLAGSSHHWRPQTTKVGFLRKTLRSPSSVV
jgi:hypothetical protein